MNKIPRSSEPDVFLLKGVLKICRKFTGEHPCRSAISIKSLCSFIEITLRHGCSRVNLLHIFETPFSKNTSRRLLLNFKKLVRLCNKLDKFQKLFSIGNEKLQQMISSFRFYSIKESKKQLQESLSKSSMYVIYSYFSDAATRGAL